MLAQLDKLRFLRRAVDEGLISHAEQEHHRAHVLRTAFGSMQSGNAGAPNVAAAKEVTPEGEQRAWQVLVAALIEVIEANSEQANDEQHREGDVAPQSNGEPPAPGLSHRKAPTVAGSGKGVQVSLSYG